MIFSHALVDSLPGSPTDPEIQEWGARVLPHWENLRRQVRLNINLGLLCILSIPFPHPPIFRLIFPPTAGGSDYGSGRVTMARWDPTVPQAQKGRGQAHTQVQVQVSRHSPTIVFCIIYFPVLPRYLPNLISLNYLIKVLKYWTSFE